MAILARMAQRSASNSKASNLDNEAARDLPDRGPFYLEACMKRPLKILVQHIWPDPAEDKLIGEGMRVVYQGQEALMRRLIGQDTEIVQSFNPRSAYYSSCASMEAYNNVGMLEGL